MLMKRPIFVSYSRRDGVQEFKRWLDDNGIEYKYSESHGV